MDNVTISTLKDLQSKIEKNFGEIDKKIKSYSKGNKTQKTTTKKTISKNLEYIKNTLNEMILECNKLKDEETKNDWEETYNKMKSKLKEYKEKVNNLDTEQGNNDEEEKNDYLDPDAKVDLNELNVEQGMKRGDNILDAGDNAIDNMAQINNKDVEMMKNINEKLNRQSEQLGVADSDLKEMEFSINRARQKITNMFKLYASDKCITCLIVVILIIIVTIIIVSACGGDNKNNFNVPHDIFGSNNKTRTSDSYYLIRMYSLMKIIGYMILFVF